MGIKLERAGRYHLYLGNLKQMRYLKRFAAVLLLSLVPMVGATQEIVASTDSFDYGRCEDTVGATAAQNVYDAIMQLIEVYNSQPNVDVRMSDPSLSQCYYQFGKAGTFFAGSQTIKFYIDQSHFRCSIAGNCQGDRAGYQAAAMLIGEKLQLTVNTNRAEDMVQACLSSTGFNEGRCN